MSISGVLVILVLFALFWLLLIRPQRRRMQAQQDLIATLRIGDEVVTAGGLIGEITELDDDEARLEIAEGVEVRVARRAVAAVVRDDEQDEELEEGEGAEEHEPESAAGENGAEPPPNRKRTG